MSGLSKRVRAVWRVLWRSHQLERDMQDEIRFHVEMEAERLMREQGIDAQEARRQAYVGFGGVEKYKEAGRDARGRQWLDAISLDTRLGLRMLVKYRGLTLIGGFAMAVAIAIGATGFEALREILVPGLPLEDGERIVSVQYASANPANRERNVLHDFVAWRGELKSIEQLSAFRTVQRNLVSSYATPEPIKVAEMTPSGFAVARTPPLMGRYLVAADEVAGAPAVVVIGYTAWQTRFAGDPQIVGRTLNLGGLPTTVVGVMPEGFQFPFDHHFWIPFRANPLAYARLQGPSIYVFGRLAPGITIEQAQAELTIIGERVAAANPETREPLRALVYPYTRDHVDLTEPGIVVLVRLGQLLTGVLAFVVAVNLAILVYARTMTRLGEIAVRSALGASRRRILVQLFIESLALALVGAVAGLALADAALGQMQAMAHANGGVPFWIQFDLSTATVVYALGLAVVAALIMGVLPGLKATGKRVNTNLRELDGRTGSRLGSIWTTLVVAQVAVAVAVLPVAFYMVWQVARLELAGPGFAAEQFVVGTVALNDETSVADPDNVRRRQLELTSRLEAEPGVAAVTFSSFVPGFAGGRNIQFDDAATAQAASEVLRDGEQLSVSALDVALNLLDVYDADIIAGRTFNAGDLGAANAVIVNRSFVDTFLQGRAALGARFHYLSGGSRRLEPGTPQPSYQIIGVVRDFPSFPPSLAVDDSPVVYHPAEAGAIHPVILSVRFSDRIPAGFTDRFRALGADVDPALQLRRVVPLSSFYEDVRSLWRYIAAGIGLVAISVLLLSAAGIYALMSFTVAQRTREIGIRVALGAHPRRLLFGIFGRVVRQLALGVAIGSVASAVVVSTADLQIAQATSLLAAVAVIMLIVGLAAALGPARRSLRVEAIEALRADG